MCHWRKLWPLYYSALCVMCEWRNLQQIWSNCAPFPGFLDGARSQSAGWLPQAQGMRATSSPPTAYLQTNHLPSRPIKALLIIHLLFASIAPAPEIHSQPRKPRRRRSELLNPFAVPDSAGHDLRPGRGQIIDCHGLAKLARMCSPARIVGRHHLTCRQIESTYHY